MSRVASHHHQAGEGSAAYDGAENDVEIQQPFDPFEDDPRGSSDEEVGFGSLAYQDSVIIERAPTRRRPTPPRTVSAEPFARLRMARGSFKS